MLSQPLKYCSLFNSKFPLISSWERLKQPGSFFAKYWFLCQKIIFLWMDKSLIILFEFPWITRSPVDPEVTLWFLWAGQESFDLQRLRLSLILSIFSLGDMLSLFFWFQIFSVSESKCFFFEKSSWKLSAGPFYVRFENAVKTKWRKSF